MSTDTIFRIAKAGHLSLTQCLILCELSRHGARTVFDLMGALKKSESQVRKCVYALEDLNLVKCQRDTKRKGTNKQTTVRINEQIIV